MSNTPTPQSSSGYASPAPSSSSNSQPKPNNSKAKAAPNVFTNDGSFLERFQRNKKVGDSWSDKLPLVDDHLEGGGREKTTGRHVSKVDGNSL